MYLSLGVILVAGVIAYIWSARGFFSAFLHMLCVIAAGALAFAFWEPTALWILNYDTSQSGWLIDLAWGLALAIPFAIFLLVLRVACDKLVPFNLQFDGVANVVGGGACGAVSGIIAAGILVLSVSFMRLDTEFLGAKPVDYGTGGSLEYKGGLILPADRLTAWFYSTMSNGTLAPPDPNYTLGRLRPNLALEGWLMRVSFEDGKAKNATPPTAFEVQGRYQLTGDRDGAGLFGDNSSPRKHTFNYLDGTQASPGSSVVEGFIVKFKSGAKEQSGRIVVGPGQLSLLVQKDQNDPYSTTEINPLAVISQAQGDKPTLGRWRFDANNVFISSVGGRDDAPMAFEFAVPKGATPIALYVKGVRNDVDGMKPGTTYGSVSQRDEAIRSGAIMIQQADRKVAAPSLDTRGAVRARIDTNAQDSPVKLGNTLPWGIILQKDILKGLEIDDERNITGGSLSKFRKDEMSRIGDDRKLQVNKLYVNVDTTIVQVIVDARNKQWGFLSDVAASADRSGKPTLIDAQGQTFSAAGYMYQAAGETWIYYSPQAPILNMNDREMPTLSRSQPDQQLILFFAVSKNVKLKYFTIGDKTLADFVPPVEVK